MTTPDATIRVMIADDHPLFRKGMRTLLGAAPDIQLLGEAESGDRDRRLAFELQPDVVLMDLQMPGGGGMQATRRNPDARPDDPRPGGHPLRGRRFGLRWPSAPALAATC